MLKRLPIAGHLQVIYHRYFNKTVFHMSQMINSIALAWRLFLNGSTVGLKVRIGKEQRLGFISRVVCCPPVRPSVRRPSLTFRISENAEQILTNLYKKYSMSSTKCVF